MPRLEVAKRALAQSEAEFFRRPQLVALAVGLRETAGQTTNELCVKAFVRKKQPIAELPRDQVLPRRIRLPNQQTVAVDVAEMAPAWAPPCFAPDAAAPALDGFRTRRRPAIGGVSIAHYAFDIGTLGAVVRDRQDSRFGYVLSNNHVLARLGAARTGDPILQPARADGGRYPQDQIAQLCRTVPIRFEPGSSNVVDAAVGCAVFADVDRRVFWGGPPRAVVAKTSVRPGARVQKTGRTTGHTEGTIVGINGTVLVNYAFVGSEYGITTFREQIITTQMSGYGDSGSLLLDLDGNAMGLLFGGSYTHTYYNYIDDVQRELGIVVAENTI